jgi:hypothetical protein
MTNRLIVEVLTGCNVSDPSPGDGVLRRFLVEDAAGAMDIAQRDSVVGLLLTQTLATRALSTAWVRGRLRRFPDTWAVIGKLTEGAVSMADLPEDLVESEVTDAFSMLSDWVVWLSTRLLSNLKGSANIGKLKAKSNIASLDHPIGSSPMG